MQLNVPQNQHMVKPSNALKLETCKCTGHCADCLQTEELEKMHRNDASSLALPSSGDDYDRMPSDWFSSASSDSAEAIVDKPVTVSAASVSNFSIKDEPDDAESLSPFVSTQPVSPSIVIKGETCPCKGDCLDCMVKRSPPCPKCGKTFSRNSQLKIHQRVHTGERPYVCAQCPKAFIQLGALKYHQLTHQAVRSRPFRCTAEGCEKAYLTKGELTRHIPSHRNERPFACSVCGKTFKLLWHLKQHQVTHQAVSKRSFCCSAEGCGKAFLTKGELARHIRTHTSERPFACAVCAKAFKLLWSLKQHQVIHQEVRRFRCSADGCGKAFTRKQALTRHTASHGL